MNMDENKILDLHEPVHGYISILLLRAIHYIANGFYHRFKKYKPLTMITIKNY